MDSETFMRLVNNAAFLLALAVLYDTLPLKKSPRRRAWEIVTGVLIGLIGMAVMLTPWRFSEGVIFDTRSILLSLTGFFFGLIPTLLAVLMTGSLRLYQGGAGAFMGCAVILTSAGLGLAWRYILRSKNKTPRWAELYGFGIIVHIAMLLWVFALPREIIFTVLKQIWLPVILIYPLGTVLLGLLLTRQHQRSELEQSLRGSEEKSRLLFESMSQGVFYQQADGELIEVNQAALDMLGLTREQFLGRTSYDPEWKVLRADGANLLPEEHASMVALRTGKVVENMELGVYRPDTQDFIWLVANAIPQFKPGDRNPYQVFVTLHDITERKQAENKLGESEAQYRQLFDTAPLAIFIFQGGQLVLANPAAVRLTGAASPVELVGKAALDFIHPDDRDLMIQRTNNLIKGNSISPVVEEKFIRFDGNIIEAEVSNALITFEGRPAIQVVVQDITERKQILKKLHESQDRFRRLAENAADIIFRYELLPVRRLSYINPAVEGTTGYSQADCYADPDLMFNLINPDDLHRMTNYFQMLTVPAEPMLMHWIGKDGVSRWMESRLVPVMDADGDLLAVEGITRDVTENKRIEMEIRENRSFIQHLADTIPNQLYVFDLVQGQNTYINQKSEDFFGLSLAEMQAGGQALFVEMIHPDDLAKMDEFNTQWKFAQDGQIIQKEYRLRNAAGEYRWIQSYESILSRGPDGTPNQIVGIATDNSERKQAEEALQESEERYRRLVELLPNGIIVHREGLVIFANLALANMLGVSSPVDLIGKPVIGPINPDSRKLVMERIDEAMTSGIPPLPGEEILIKTDGTLVAVQLKSILFSDLGRQTILTVCTDITERKQAEMEIRQLNTELEQRVEARTHELREAQEQLVRKEKLATLGQLAGGVGHELRNPLSIINSAIYYLRMIQPEAGEKVKEYLGIIQTETHNAEKIINDLLDFSRIKSVDVEPVVVSDLVRNTLERFPTPATVQVTFNLPDNLPAVYIDPRQVTQVLGNLVLNACQAMEGGGKLLITAKLSTVNGQSLIAIAVVDTGMGITPENMRKLFEPLFTTKPKGIGLGLAVSKKLIEANGGRIEVQSEPGKGSTFTVYLPAK